MLAARVRHRWGAASASAGLLQDFRATRHFGFLPSAKRRGPRESVGSPPPLPSAQVVRVGKECALEFIDIQTSSGPPTTTLVLLHGAPGTFQDFRHFVPRVIQHLQHVRVVAINLPGFGGSRVDAARYFELLDARTGATLVLRALHQLLTRDERIVLVGHSFGGHTALDLAAQNLKQSEPRLHIHGLALLAAAGTRPHRVLRPRENRLLIRSLELSPPPIRSLLERVVKTFYTSLLGFPSGFPSGHYVAGVVRAGTTDFDAVHENVVLVRSAGVRSLSAWSSDDEFMEEDIPVALAEALGSERRIAFQGAGHNLQKTRADALAHEISSWLQRLDLAEPSETPVPVETRP